MESKRILFVGVILTMVAYSSLAEAQFVPVTVVPVAPAYPVFAGRYAAYPPGPYVPPPRVCVPPAPVCVAPAPACVAPPVCVQPMPVAVVVQPVPVAVACCRCGYPTATPPPWPAH